MNYKEIYSDIKKKYNKVQGTLQKNPWYFDLSTMLLLIIAILLVAAFIIDVCMVKWGGHTNSGLRGGIYILMVIFWPLFIFYKVAWSISRKKLMEKSEAAKELCRENLKDEAKKHDVSAEFLAWYLYINYKIPKWTKVLQFISSVVFTSVAVYYLPSWNKQSGFWGLILIIIANIIIAKMGDFMANKLVGLSKEEFEFLVIRPFEEEFNKFEK